MIALVLGMSGCAQHIFPLRDVDCESYARIEVDAPDYVYLEYEPSDDDCDVSVNSAARVGYDEGTIRIENAGQVYVRGRFSLDVTWGEELEARAAEDVWVSSRFPGNLQYESGLGLSCESCNLDVQTGSEIALRILADGVMRVCSSASGTAFLDGGTLILSLTGGFWSVDGAGTLEGEVYTESAVVFSDTIEPRLTAGGATFSACCDALGSDCEVIPVGTADTCMACHNGGVDYSGQGLSDPHPWSSIGCVGCHGGDSTKTSIVAAHVPVPEGLSTFRNRTLAGVELLPDYTVQGVDFEPLDWLQFRNPGDLRVVSAGRGCGLGTCHAEIRESILRSPMATNAGIFSVPSFHTDEPATPANEWGTRAQLAFADVTSAVDDGAQFFSGIATSGSLAWNVGDFGGLSSGGGVVPVGSVAEALLERAVDAGCGSCHLGTAGPNGGPGQFRSSGCTACHMPYALDGRSDEPDPNLDPSEPADPESVRSSERPHPRRHLLHSTRDEETGRIGIPDQACAPCHVGSGGTSLEYQGLRLDPNADVVNGLQYPQNPAAMFALDGVGTLYGYPYEMLMHFEDYDGDNRDDTPPDVHFEAQMGCIDCHTGVEVHGSDALPSHSEQATTIRCETCHGTLSQPPDTAPCPPGSPFDTCVVDSAGQPLGHVGLEPGTMVLTLKSRVNPVVRTIPLVMDVVASNPKAQLAMTPEHLDKLECYTCHASWTNTCVSCHVEVSATNQAVSSSTGSSLGIALETGVSYSTPLYFSMGVGPRGRIQPFVPATPTLFRFTDANGNTSGVGSLSDRMGRGTDLGGALTHGPVVPHTIRGRVEQAEEGPRYCTACHLVNDPTAMEAFLQGEISEFVPSPNSSALDFRNVVMAAGLGTGLWALDAEGCAIAPGDPSPYRAGCGGPAHDAGEPRYRIDRRIDVTGDPKSASLHAILTDAPNVPRGNAPDAGKAGPLPPAMIERLVDTTMPLDVWIDADGVVHGP